MKINWYPGHMVTAQNEIKASLKLIDVVVEIVDSRIPYSSQNKVAAKLTEGKKKIVVLNKIDLADLAKVTECEKRFKEEGINTVRVDASSGKGIKELLLAISKIGASVYAEKNSKLPNPIVRALIIGIPNVGKSTIINKLSNKTSAKVGNKPGVTVRKQWIRVGSNIELLDTPGILWPNLDDQDAGLKLALTGNIKQEILDIEELCAEGLKEILKSEKYTKMLVDRYKLDEEEIANVEQVSEIMDIIGKKRGCLLRGGLINYEKVSTIFLDDFKNGRIGKISLE
ncbi:MAG: ribosome biogenesis GTPase YlqF [Clostridia bacterium]